MLETVWGIMIMGVLPVTVGITLLLISPAKGLSRDVLGIRGVNVLTASSIIGSREESVRLRGVFSITTINVLNVINSMSRHLMETAPWKIVLIGIMEFVLFAKKGTFRKMEFVKKHSCAKIDNMTKLVIFWTFEDIYYRISISFRIIPYTHRKLTPPSHKV